MSSQPVSRRDFIKLAGTVSGAALLKPVLAAAIPATAKKVFTADADQAVADCTLRIAATLVEIASKHIVSCVTYNGQFPGPLLRFKEGQQAIVDVHNDTDTPEQLHWHGQFVPVDVDGSAEEGTPFIPARECGESSSHRPCWFSLLSHAQSRRRGSPRKSIQRPSWSRIY